MRRSGLGSPDRVFGLDRYHWTPRNHPAKTEAKPMASVSVYKSSGQHGFSPKYRVFRPASSLSEYEIHDFSPKCLQSANEIYVSVRNVFTLNKGTTFLVRF